jgi:hypothetical protein
MPVTKSSRINMRMRDPLTNRMFGATLLAGALSGITFMMVPGALFVGPGILFGVATAWFFKTCEWIDSVQAILWIIATTASWYAAIETYIAYGSNPVGGAPSGGLTNMLIAGLVGSGLVAVVLSLLVRRVNVISIIVTLACGVILAATMYAVLKYGSGTQITGGTDGGLLLSYAKLAIAFAIWQAGVGLSLLGYKPKHLR